MLNALNYSASNGGATRKHKAQNPLVLEAIRVFGEEERAMRWLNHPLKAFNGKKPIDLLNSKEGQELVSDRLIGIDEGMYS